MTIKHLFIFLFVIAAVSCPLFSKGVSEAPEEPVSKNMEYEELAELVNNADEDYFLIDVRTADEYNAYFKTLDWKPKIGKIEDSSNGVMFSYSPQRKSDLYKGGFNVVAEVGGNGKSTFWISDEFDLGAGALKNSMRPISLPFSSARWIASKC